ncbi:hypothetical protein C3747_2g299 [Trypanosoma cruzi]|uniref:Uncharacterized protein n=2 Tax=Trypanosoma cruzi TaxID=5693 RepID=Q4D9Y9_TRYCC|nr:hypothetical protein, conserved [Trypanosoma cruzi]EAN89342.1 hypothetical protein, conserved [Trypanosoma cruzi]PWV21699.1 hypothetical protein C3747_2g299 [Trypanosoma cruzi]|eukprot:XP_811193.1 hypothetical protein [Trypanosoma cruzi strain CL Brener]
MSHQGVYEDDFELDEDEISTDRERGPPLTPKSVDASPAAREVTRGKETLLPEPHCMNGKKSIPIVKASSGRRPPQLIHPPASRIAKVKPPVVTGNQQLLHLSKLTSVTQMEPDSERLKHNVNRNEVPARTSEPRTDVLSSSSTPLSGRKCASSPALAMEKGARHCATAVAPREHLRTLPPMAGRRASSNEEKHVRPPWHQESESVLTNEDKKNYEEADVWKRKTNVSPMKAFAESQFKVFSGAVGSPQAPPTAQSAQHGGGDEKSTLNTKEVLWQRPKQISGSSCGRISGKDHESSFCGSSSDTESLPRDACRRKKRKAGVKNNEERASVQDNQTYSSDFSSDTESPPRNASREELQKAILKTRYEVANVRRVRRALEISLQTTTRSSIRRGYRRAHMDVDRLDRENQHLQRLLGLREQWIGFPDLALRIAEEELKYSLDELQRAKRRQRDLWTENRRLSIFLTQVVRDHKPVEEKVASQYREGMYNRLTIQSKLDTLREKLAATRESSARLSDQIRNLEDRVRAAGLTCMKPEEYTAMQRAVRRNTEQIEKLSAIVTVPLGTKEDGSHGDMRLSSGSLSSVQYPGRSQMDALVMKLVKQVERKEALIKLLRQRLAETEPTVSTGKEEVLKLSPRECALTGEKRNSLASQLTPNMLVRNAGSLSPRQMDSEVIARSISFSKKEGPREPQHQQSKKGGDRVNGAIEPRDAEGGRVTGAEQPTSGLAKQDKTLLEHSEWHKNGCSSSPGVISSSNTNQPSRAVYEAVANDAKNRLVLNDGTTVKMNGLTQYNGLDESQIPIDDSQLRLSPTTLTKLSSTKTGDIPFTEKSSSVEKEEAGNAAQGTRETGRTTPLWLREY